MCYVARVRLLCAMLHYISVLCALCFNARLHCIVGAMMPFQCIMMHCFYVLCARFSFLGAMCTLLSAMLHSLPYAVLHCLFIMCFVALSSIC